ncbi:hypothetical protein SDC9_93225 [bioreactor metagenome]|uniref:Uncharacterized protein n=1 Tax=bioreactor metagenome TaxID=1076179 RepID=A0A645A0G0_9ZZZZ
MGSLFQAVDKVIYRQPDFPGRPIGRENVCEILILIKNKANEMLPSSATSRGQPDRGPSGTRLFGALFVPCFFILWRASARRHHKVSPDPKIDARKGRRFYKAGAASEQDGGPQMG